MADIKKTLLLIVEDDEVLLRALYLVFHKNEYTIATATDGEMALSMARRLKPQIILLDLILPKLDGFNVLKNLQADPALAQVPVVVLSNLGSDEDIARARSLGAADYFVKATTNLEQLELKIKDIISKRS